jgi:hypothetical protein
MGAQPDDAAPAQHGRGRRAAEGRVMRPAVFLPLTEASALLLLAAALRTTS